MIVLNWQKIVFLCSFVVSRTLAQTCTCDLVQGLCEVNCCCDTTDCSVNDTVTFSTCTESTFNEASFLCAYDQVVFVNNLQQATARDQLNNLFCVQTDNFAERNFYISPSCISSDTCFNFADQGFTFASDISTNTNSAFYQSGDKISIEYTTGVRSYFSVPTNGISNVCQDNAPVQYFTDRSSSCTRVLSSISSSCVSENSLNYATYFENFDVYSTPLSNSSLDLLNITIASCLIDGNEVVENCTGPVLNGANCDNVVTEVSYLVTTDGFNGIVDTTVYFVLQQISDLNLPLVQTFSVNFQTLQNVGGQVTVRSGNPGYLNGKPMISAVREQGTLNVNQNSIPGLEISLIDPDFSGVCSQSKTRRPVLFRESMRTGCQISVAGLSCSTLQENIKVLLDGSFFNGSNDVFIGVFGNTGNQTLQTQSTPSDWVQVMQGAYSASPANDTSGCAGMVLTSRFDILYANSGSITNPQPKVIAARYIYGDPQFLRYQCSGGVCNSLVSTQTVEISTSVNFIDISETPVSLLQQNPAFESKFPGDFFYPLKGSCVFISGNIPVILLNFVALLFLHLCA